MDKKNNNFDVSKIESGSTIRDIIKNIKRDMKRLTSQNNNVDLESELKVKYSSFEEKYPTLFKKIITNELENEQMLEHMLQMLDNVKLGKMSEFDASADVGKKLYNKHVKPKIN